ncbi:protein TIC 62, chloroplastic isoform X2 [Cinnamomum micranthum f. kanehirae]|uniref:Protein TIC 62, chloroplastic isoform X2 n=1 Tax=Cinnamomum micranthum f. kanehirae TaxID=337451 RepID=A0A3S3NAR3_9MAGN|nr:protein TIC 62, chloroplastic isoform X2 [Cinnamomum micranthum f. kanehirae]
MDHLLSLHSHPVTALPSSIRSSLDKSSFLSGQNLTIPKNKRCPDAGNLKFLDFRARTLGPGTSEANPKTIKAVKQDTLSKDEDLAFVAGSTGRVGSRTVRELLKLGFRVRAGVRSVQKAESLVQSVKQLKLDGAASTSGTQPVEKLELVECDLERDAIGPAIGNSSIVICCIGASEKEVFDVTGPYRIDYQAAKRLVDAATAAKVNHFILLTSLGTNKIGFPASILNLFWGVLIWKRKAEEALIASGLPYTIVRPGGMERPTDAYKETHNLVLANEDIYFGGQVSNLQVAELMAFMAQDRSLSFCKVVEVIAETTAPLTPMGELLSKIPSQRVDTSSLKVDSKPDVPPSQRVVSEPSTVMKEPIQTEAQKTRPLSPYIAYEDLKPPTSPTPTPSTTPESPKESHVNATKAESIFDPQMTQISISGPTTSSIAKELTQTEVPKPRPLSPYFVYGDLKPPTSPSPRAPTISLISTPPIESSLQRPSMDASSISEVPRTDKPVDKQHLNLPKMRPLSPFTMYEDLKPPSSPMPSSPVQH